MKRHPLNRLAIVTIAAIMLLAIAPSSCKQNPAGKPADAETAGVERVDSADSAYWDKYTMNYMVKVLDYGNNGQTDSLEAIAPEAMKVCREHNQVDRYYYIWGTLAERYIYDDEFAKTVAETQRMQDTAMKRHEDYGMYISYSMLGQSYAYRGNYEDAVKFLRKALDHYHSGQVGPVFTTYYYLVLDLVQLKRFEEADSALTQWNNLIEENGREKFNENYETWCAWKNNYFIQRSAFLMAQEKYKEAAQALDSAEYYTNEEGNTPLTRLTVLEKKGELSSKQEDYRATLKYGRQMYDLATEINDNGYRLNALYIQADACEGLERYEDALDIIIRAISFKDSLDQINDNDKLNELNKRFEVNEVKMQAERDKMQAERKQMQAERRQLYLIIAIIVLAALGGGMFFIYRLRSARRLAKMRAAQERIEGELKIARDIQMSMVPSTFPDYEGLDMFASMTPAKEVGGGPSQ